MPVLTYSVCMDGKAVKSKSKWRPLAVRLAEKQQKHDAVLRKDFDALMAARKDKPEDQDIEKRLDGARLRAVIVAAARGWIGTPYRHQMSVKGEGCDCIGLVRGVWREVVGPEPWVLPPYSPDWAEVGGREILLDGLGRWLSPVAMDAARVGDVLVFRMRDGRVAKHAAILSMGEGVEDRRARVAHAYWGHAVVESWLGPYWRRRLAGAFRFPGI